MKDLSEVLKFAGCACKQESFYILGNAEKRIFIYTEISCCGFTIISSGWIREKKITKKKRLQGFCKFNFGLKWKPLGWDSYRAQSESYLFAHPASKCRCTVEFVLFIVVLFLFHYVHPMILKYFQLYITSGANITLCIFKTYK